MDKYRPSNGTEGMSFVETHCMNCLHCDPDPNGKKQCHILLATMCYDIEEPQYPSEWCYIDGKPTCTKWQKWDWGNDGDPDDPDNPNAPVPSDPNQLMLFSITDNIFDVCKPQLETATK